MVTSVYELDHIFVCSEVGAPEAEALSAFGLTEGAPNQHPGQGTANRRFFFHNAFLELLWVSDPAEAQSEATQRTQLWQRWSQRKSTGSPFGICLRPKESGTSEVPFPSWEYRPTYLPHPLAIHAAKSNTLAKPWWFYVSFGRRPDAPDWSSHQPLGHPAGFREITHVCLTFAGAEHPSSPAMGVPDSSMVTMAAGQEALLELSFDNSHHGKSHDFRPSLPLLFHW